MVAGFRYRRVLRSTNGARQNQNSGSKNNSNSHEITPPPPAITNNQATTYYQQSPDDKPKGWHKFVAFPEGITAWLVMFTLGAIVWQSWETRKSAEAALAQGRHTERTTKQELRAYLCIETACVKITEGVAINGQPGTILEGQVYLKNFGQTPAYDVRTWVHGSIRPYPETDPVSNPREGLPRGIAIVPPRGEPNPICAKRITITAEVFASLKSRNTAYYVQGEICYRDIFKEWHRLKFRLLHGGPGGTRTGKDANGVPVGYFVPDSWGNSEEDIADPDGPQKPN